MFRLCSTEDSIEPENSLSLCKEMLFLGFVILRVLNSGVLAAGSYSSRFLGFLVIGFRLRIPLAHWPNILTSNIEISIIEM